MNVLTWFGAVLRTDGVRRRLVQDPIWMTSLDGLDFEAAGEAVATPLGSLQVLPRGRPGIVRLGAGGRYLTAWSAQRDLSLEPEDSEAVQAFLLIRPDDLADLRQILSESWRVQPSRQLLQKADIRLGQGFTLMLGGLTVDLPSALPLGSAARRAGVRGHAYTPPPSYLVPRGDPDAAFIELAESGAQPVALATQLELFARSDDPVGMLAHDQTLANATHGHMVLREAAGAILPAPMMLTSRDRMVFGRYPQPANPAGQDCHLRRAPLRYVCLCRGAEGLVFDADGASSDLSGLAQAALLPAGFSRREGMVWLDRAMMDAAPRLSGPHLVFYDSTLDNPDDWLSGAMPVLDLLALNAPPEPRVLLPAGLGRIGRSVMPFDHREVMAAVGYSQIAVVESAAPIVLVEDLFYMDRPAPAALPAAELRAFRDRVLRRHDGRGEAVRRIYLRPPPGSGASLARREGVERFLLRQGFEPIQADEMPVTQQIEVFRGASFVVGDHGAGLAGILFAPPGLRVLEMMETPAFQPNAWRLAAKLGHLHGVLCRDGEDFDAACFSDLFTAMEAFRS